MVAFSSWVQRCRRTCKVRPSTGHLGTWFDVPAAGPCAVCLLRATADHHFVCLDVFLGFSVGGITVPVETLMTKLVVCYYHGRGQSIQVSHFSDSFAEMSGFAVTRGAIVGPVSREESSWTL